MRENRRIVSIEQAEDLFSVHQDTASPFLVRRFTETPGVSGSPLADELASLVPDESYTHLAFSVSRLRKLAGKIADFLRGCEVRVLGTQLGWLSFPVHTLYCPPLPDAEASLAIEAGTAEAAIARLSILGTGGTGEFLVEMNIRDELHVRGEHAAIVYELASIWEHCEIQHGSGEPTSFVRIVRIEPYDRRFIKKLTVKVPEPAWGPVSETHDFDLRQSDANLTHTLRMEAGASLEGSMGIKLEQFGIESSLSYSAKVKWVSEYSYKLVPGHTYRATRYAGGMHWWWDILA